MATSDSGIIRLFDDDPQVSERVTVRYPRSIRTRDGEELTVTPMVPSDWKALERFLREAPDAERKFFRHDAPDPARVELWCSKLDYRSTLPLLVWSGDRIVADGVLQRDSGVWTSHVGRLRLLVHTEQRGRGIGRALLSELIAVAQVFDLHKLTYECAADQTKLISLLASLHFIQAARLPDFIRDRDGGFHEMVLMVLSLD